MKKNTPNTDRKDKLNPMKDTSNYAAGREGEDILDREDEELEEPLADEEVFPEDEFDDDEDIDDEDDEDDDKA